MDEASKFRARWQKEGLWDRYFTGKILDVGCGSDKITPDADPYDVDQGDAQYLSGIADATYDTCFSSHCIEHMRDPIIALWNWWRVLKPKGHLIVVGPERDLYEHGIWPSVFNPDHKATFTIDTDYNWSPRNYNLTDLVKVLSNRKVVSLRIVDTGYDYSKLDKFEDQSLGNAEVAFELVVQKDPIKLHRYISKHEGTQVVVYQMD